MNSVRYKGVTYKTKVADKSDVKVIARCESKAQAAYTSLEDAHREINTMAGFGPKIDRSFQDARGRLQKAMDETKEALEVLNQLRSKVK